MEFHPRRETALIEPAGRHIFHDDDRLGVIRYQLPSIHQQKDAEGKEALTLVPSTIGWFFVSPKP
jgi:hypothetical protein